MDVYDDEVPFGIRFVPYCLFLLVDINKPVTVLFRRLPHDVQEVTFGHPQPNTDWQCDYWNREFSTASVDPCSRRDKLPLESTDNARVDFAARQPQDPPIFAIGTIETQPFQVITSVASIANARFEMRLHVCEFRFFEYNGFIGHSQAADNILRNGTLGDFVSCFEEEWWFPYERFVPVCLSTCCDHQQP